MPAASVSSSARVKSSIPVSHMKALNPITPSPASSSSRSGLPGTRPPQSARSTWAAPLAAAAFAAKPAALTVAGIEFSGMSAAHVAPPAASARVPVATPSQWARPGSFRWTCTSTAPGSTSRAVASISVAPASSPGPISAMTPSVTPRSSWRPRMTRSCIGRTLFRHRGRGLWDGRPKGAQAARSRRSPGTTSSTSSPRSESRRAAPAASGRCRTRSSTDRPA